jgi:hypothetical protein
VEELALCKGGYEIGGCVQVGCVYCPAQAELGQGTRFPTRSSQKAAMNGAQQISADAIYSHSMVPGGFEVMS